MREIEIIVDTNGEISLDLQGYHGKGCSKIAEELAKAIGTKISSDKKCEYWETETKAKQRIRSKL